MEKMGREEIVAMYKPDVERLLPYLSWLRDKSGADVTKSYEADDNKKTIAFPVYDGTLLAFLSELGSTAFMNQNYRYIYSRYRIRDHKDELMQIDKADIMSMEILGGILSKYTLGGMTKAYLWTEGVEHQIFYRALLKAKSIIEYWDVPLENTGGDL